MPHKRHLAAVAVAFTLVALVALAAEETRPRGATAGTAASHGTASAEGTARVGVVDLERITRESTMLKARLVELEDEIKGKTEARDAKVREGRRLRADLDRRKSLLTAEQVTAEEGELKKLAEGIEELEFQIKRLVRRTEDEIVGPALAELLRVTNTVGRENGYDLILRADLVLYAGPQVDITELVLERLDANAPAVPGAPPATPVAAAVAPPQK